VAKGRPRGDRGGLVKQTMGIGDPTPEYIAAALAGAGLGAQVGTLEREDRTAAFLAGDRIAWFPRNADGLAALQCEARVLRLVERHCAFACPRMLHEDAAGWQLRSMVSGTTEPFEVYARAKSDKALAARIGGQIGRILADQHCNIPMEDLGGWLPATKNWPRKEDLGNLPLVVEDKHLLARFERVLARRREIPVMGSPVLAHCDVGFHNIAFDPVTDDVAGVFDYDGAALDDRHQDFKLLVLHREDDEEPMLEAAIAAYEPIAGVRIDRERVHLFNALESAGFLGFRFGHAPEEDWCGRTLAQDLAWANLALPSAGF